MANFTDQQFAQLLANMPVHAPHKKLSIFSSGDGQEWTTWRKNFNTVAAISAWNDARKIQEISSSMEGEAARAVADIAEAAHTPNEFLDLYEARFIPVAASQLARSEFKLATQRPGETLLQFHTSLRETYIRAYPLIAGDVNTSLHLIDTFADGLTNLEVGREIIKEQPATYAAALTVAQARMAVEMRYSKTSAQGGAGVRSMGAPQAPPTEAEEGVANVSTMGCWLCGNTSHFKRDCPDLWKAQRYYNNLVGNQRGGPQGGRRGNAPTRGWTGMFRGRGTGAGRGGNRGQGYHAHRGGPRGNRPNRPSAPKPPREGAIQNLTMGEEEETEEIYMDGEEDDDPYGFGTGN